MPATDWAALARAAYAGRTGRSTDNQLLNIHGNAIGEDPGNPTASMVIDPVTGEGKYMTPDGREVPYPGSPSWQAAHPAPAAPAPTPGAVPAQPQAGITQQPAPGSTLNALGSTALNQPINPALAQLLDAVDPNWRQKYGGLMPG